MKKKIVSLLIIMGLCPVITHAAATYSMYAPSSVENGNTVTATLTLKATAAWNVKITSAGSTSGCTTSFADATSNGKNATKTLSVTCKATSLGVISFTATGDITNEDGATTNVSVTKKTTVVPPREKSSDASLASLSVEGYELSPKFDKETLNYKVQVPSTVDKIKLDAKVNESHASLTGTGEYEVTEGINTFKILVTSETGKTMEYTVNVIVEDQNPIEITINNEKYTIIKNPKSLTQPNLFEEKTIKINEFDIPAFYNDVSKMTLIGIKNASGDIFLAIYNEEEQSYQFYHEYKNSNLTLYITDFKEEIENYKKVTLTINDQNVSAYKFQENSRFAIIYALNLETGEYNYYSYDTKEESFQIWNKEEIEALKKEKKTYYYSTIAFAGTVVFFLLIIIYLIRKSSKYKKIINKAKAKHAKKKELEEKETKEEKKEENITDEK